METTSDTQNRLSLPTTQQDVMQCAVCDEKVNRSDVAEHTMKEMERLQQQNNQSQSSLVAEASSTSSSMENGESATDRRKPWAVFKRVQKNRQLRLKQRTRKRATAAATATVSEINCPLCNVGFPQDKIQRHAEQCLRRSNGNTNGFNTSSDDDEEYEEYEWAGQKRIRVSSLLRGGYASLGIGQSTANASGSVGIGRQLESEDEDLNVVEDDTHIYGPAQYGEGDVLHIDGDLSDADQERAVTSYVRSLITERGANNTVTNASPAAETNENDDGQAPEVNGIVKQEEVVIPEDANATVEESALTSNQYQHIIKSLKDKLRHYESNAQNKFKCLICLDDYRNPAISVSCWHVHCETCWMRSLGARKLCPQCNLITTPKDLRRIYM